MPSIRLTGDIAHITEGTRAQAADLNLTLAEDGFPVAVTIRKGPLEVLTEAESGAIFCGSRAEFFRGLTMLAARFDERPFRVRETPALDLLGAMLDCSRNAVPTMEAAKTFLRRLSRMGYNAVLLYTEDTYEVAGRPYFGYLRGRFSQAELRELDQYADALGIEMIPCIQTLGHMARALRWPCMEDVRDTDDVLLLDEEKTYALIEEMIVSASRPFATRRIHIGMDEAYGLGRGKYMDRHGYVPQSELMQKHLARIGDILKKHGLHAMMWSDMYFHMAQPGNAAAYPAGCTLSEAIVAAAPLFSPQETVEAFERALAHEPDAVICTHVSNVFGAILPIERIAQLCRGASVPLIIDASQSAGSLPIDFSALAPAFLAMPGHKGLYGPQGTGLLLCGSDALPLIEGGTGSESLRQSMPDFLPDRLEAGTHNVPGIAGLEAGIAFVRAQRPERILHHSRALIRRAGEGLGKIPNVHGFLSLEASLQAGVLSFTVDGLSPESVAEEMAKRGIALRAGLHCAPFAHKTVGTLPDGTVRLSASAFNRESEIDTFLSSLRAIAAGQAKN